MSEKLKPCPFCGSEAHVHKHVLSPDFFTIDCSNSRGQIMSWRCVPLSDLEIFIRRLKERLENGTLNNSKDLYEIARSSFIHGGKEINKKQTQEPQALN